MHHGNAVRDPTHDLNVVADEHHRKAPLCLKRLQHGDDLHLHRRVERRDDLVADQELRLGQERPGDADALALPPGQLVRIAGEMLAAEPDIDQRSLDPDAVVAA